MGRVPGLDGLRGVAILCVVSYHAFGFPAAGMFGVDLFFVLSGYLITSLLIHEHRATGAISLRRFWGRRARRLLPALILYFAVLAVLGAAYAEPALIVKTGIASLYTTNLFAAFDLLGESAEWIGGLWSLAAEEQFYLVWPLALIVLLRRGGLRVALCALLALSVAGFVVVAASGDIHQLHYSPIARSAPIVAGCVLAVISLRFRGGLVAGGVLFAAACVLGDASVAGMRVWAPVALAGATLLVANAGSARALAVAPLAWFGGISYALYLWHPFFLNVAPVGVALVAAVAAGYASTRWVENPIRHGRSDRAKTGRVVAHQIP